MIKVAAFRTALAAAALAAAVSVLGTTAAHAGETAEPKAPSQLSELVTKHGLIATTQNNPWD
ncbi:MULTISPECIES: hypothetical protein [Streptomyces]|uniref:hypothetical protein n=1 Tax=Streptomyces TaxID=1883 RepID=UPI000CD4E4D3|nr:MULTISPECIES: hypothetical protein [Streptomyces]